MKCYRQACIAVITLLAALAIPLALAAQDGAAQAKKAQHHHYRVIDVGTFGGPQSYPPDNSGVFQTTILDNHGVLIGGADTSQPDPFPNFCFADCFVVHAFRTRREDGELTDLGTLPGSGSSIAQWVSRNGLIAGFSENGQTDPLLPGVPELRAVLWTNGGITDLGTLQGGYESIASAVNSRGEVAGTFTNTTPDPDSMVGTGYQTRAFVWRDGGMQDLGTLGGTDSEAFLINEGGQVVGWSYTSSIPVNCGFGLFIALGSFIWDADNGMRDLGGLGGLCTNAAAINNRGQVVGSSDFKGDTSWHAFLWDGSIHDLGGTIGGHLSQAFGMNDAGEAVGFATVAGDVQGHAALWTGMGKITDLGVLGSFQCSFAQSINAKRQVVGDSRPDCVNNTSGLRPFLWEDGSIVDLNALIPPDSPLFLNGAQSINDRGEIAGTGVDASGNGRAVLLIPCDDDHPGIEGCDYGMVDGSTATTAVTPTPATKVASLLVQGNPAFSRLTNPILRRFGPRFGPWNRGMGAERPALKPTSAAPAGMTTQTAAEGAPERSPSCSQGSDGQPGGESADAAVTDSSIVNGHCMVVGYYLLGGGCAGRSPTGICVWGKDAQHCPSRVLPKQLGNLWCGHPGPIPVDLARHCSFVH